MTTQTVHVQTFDYGASLSSATLRNLNDDTLVATADTTNEVTADGGLYAIVFDELSVITASTYRLRAIVGGQPLQRYVTFSGVDGEVVQSATDGGITKIATIETSTTTTIPALINTLGANSIGTVTRATDDQTPLSFVWPVTGAATALGTNSLVSIDDGATFAAITGAITELGLIDGKYWYQIAFNGADRPAAQGVSWFRILDGTYTKFFNLTIPSIAIETSVQSTLDRLGFTLAALAGNCADPQTAAETYSIILGANTFTIDHTGLDATGTRTTATLTKS
jgi:hypothetical protein